MGDRTTTWAMAEHAAIAGMRELEARRAKARRREADDCGPVDAQALAVLEVLGWPDDRNGSAHVEDDGHEVTRAGAYWDIAVDVARAVLDAGRAP